MSTLLRNRYDKAIVFLLCIVPFLLLSWRWYHHNLGINRLETVARFTGDWTIRCLLISLSITPLRRITGWNDLIRFRRMIGLFAFFYGTLHFFHYLHFDKVWTWQEISEDFRIRRFYIMGLIAWTAMLPLALTSTKWAIRKLGKKWQLLHRLAYVSAAAGAVHFFWQGKAALLDPVIYIAIVVLLLAFRLVTWAMRKWTVLATTRQRQAA